MLTDLPRDVILCIGLQLNEKKDIVNYFTVTGHKFGRLELDEVARMLEVPYSDKLEKLLEYSTKYISSLVPEFILQDDTRILKFQYRVTLSGFSTQYSRIVREVFSDIEKYGEFRRDILCDIILKKNFEMLKVVLEQENVGDLLGTLTTMIGHKLEELSFLILRDGRCLNEEKAYFKILDTASKFRALGILDFCLLFAHFPSKEISEEELSIIANSVAYSNSTLVAKRIANIFRGRDVLFFEEACRVDNLKLARYFFERRNITEDEVLSCLRNCIKYKVEKVFTYLYRLYIREDELKNELLELAFENRLTKTAVFVLEDLKVCKIAPQLSMNNIFSTFGFFEYLLNSATIPAKNELLMEALQRSSFECFVLLLEKGADPSYDGNIVLHYIVNNNYTNLLKRIVRDNRVREESIRTSRIYDVVEALGYSHCEVVSILFSVGILSRHNSSELLSSSVERNDYKLTRVYVDEGLILQQIRLRRLLDYAYRMEYRKTRAELLRLWKSYNTTSYIEYLAEYGLYEPLREILNDESKKYISRGDSLHIAIEGDYIRIVRLLLNDLEVNSDTLYGYLGYSSKKMDRLLTKFL